MSGSRDARVRRQRQQQQRRAASRQQQHADEALDAIYAEVPEMLDCKGLCHDSCGPIPLTQREKQRMKASTGVEIPPAMSVIGEVLATEGQWECPALDTVTKLCRGYEVRPLVCRLWGAVDDLRCVHGCVPKGGFLTPEKAGELKQRSVEAGGEVQL